MKTRIWVALLVIYLVWGATYLAIRLAVEHMPPFLMAGSRFLIAGSVLFIWRRLAGDETPKLKDWRIAGIIGLFFVLGGNGGVTWAEQMVPSGIAALVIATSPLWMVVIDLVLPGTKRPNLLAILGVLVGFIGIFLLIGPQQFMGVSSGLHPVGIFVLLLSALSWAVGTIYAREAARPSSAIMRTSMLMLVGGGVLFVLGSITGEWRLVYLTAIPAVSWAGFLYLILFGSIVGFITYNWLLRVAPTPLVSTYAYVNPVIAILLGTFLVNEPLTARIIIAAVIIVFAVVLITFALHPSAQPEDQTVYAPGGND
jgi:drug/metabolite transporter (DMT)-like permease